MPQKIDESIRAGAVRRGSEEHLLSRVSERKNHETTKRGDGTGHKDKPNKDIFTETGGRQTATHVNLDATEPRGLISSFRSINNRGGGRSIVECKLTDAIHLRK